MKRTLSRVERRRQQIEDQLRDRRDYRETLIERRGKSTEAVA